MILSVDGVLVDSGVITVEFPLMNLMDQTQFDAIYHEHFITTPLPRWSARHGMTIFDVQELSTHGGSSYLRRLQQRYLRPSPRSRRCWNVNGPTARRPEAYADLLAC